jgi:hypothetical protein
MARRVENVLQALLTPIREEGRTAPTNHFRRLAGWLGLLREMAIGLSLVTVIGVTVALILWLVTFRVAQLVGANG